MNSLPLENTNRLQALEFDIVGDGVNAKLSSAAPSWADCRFVSLAAGETRTLSIDIGKICILLFTKCTAIVNGIKCDGRGVFISAEENISISTELSSSALCLFYKPRNPEWESKITLPQFISYDTAPKYREDCKSEKTISRMLLAEGVLPDIAMGSVETWGEDCVLDHEHPFCDQLFFSFEENYMRVVIDGESFEMCGNTLLHIPLGSLHGVRVDEGGCAHYVWIDYV